MSDETHTALGFSGRIVEAGREHGISGPNQVVIDVGGGKCITISGMSDTVVRSFARNLYQHVSVDVAVHADTL